MHITLQVMRRAALATAHSNSGNTDTPRSQQQHPAALHRTAVRAATARASVDGDTVRACRMLALQQGRSLTPAVARVLQGPVAALHTAVQQLHILVLMLSSSSSDSTSNSSSSSSSAAAAGDDSSSSEALSQEARSKAGTATAAAEHGACALAAVAAALSVQRQPVRFEGAVLAIRARCEKLRKRLLRALSNTATNSSSESSGTSSGDSTAGMSAAALCQDILELLGMVLLAACEDLRAGTPVLAAELSASENAYSATVAAV
jgi:hypothetical protein